MGSRRVFENLVRRHSIVFPAIHTEEENELDYGRDARAETFAFSGRDFQLDHFDLEAL